MELEISLEYVRPCLKNQNQNKDESPIEMKNWMTGEVSVILLQSTEPGIQRHLMDPCSAMMHQGALNFSDAFCVHTYDDEEEDDDSRGLESWVSG